MTNENLHYLTRQFETAWKLTSYHLEGLTTVGKADEYQGFRLVLKSFEGRPVSELRMLAEELKQVPDLVSFLSIHDGQKLSLIVTCGETCGKDARILLNSQLASINGRGGGDLRLAQGGGVATVEQYRSFLSHIDIK